MLNQRFSAFNGGADRLRVVLLRFDRALSQHNLRIKRGQPRFGIIKHRLVGARVDAEQQVAFFTR